LQAIDNTDGWGLRKACSNQGRNVLRSSAIECSIAAQIQEPKKKLIIELLLGVTKEDRRLGRHT
jgi:hypothetical protein